MKPVGIDWDLTLVDGHGEFYPGAVSFIRRLRKRGYLPFIHSCRANWPGGKAQIKAQLATVGLHMEIVGKPSAVAYVDNLAAPISNGDFSAAFDTVRSL